MPVNLLESQRQQAAGQSDGPAFEQKRIARYAVDGCLYKLEMFDFGVHPVVGAGSLSVVFRQQSLVSVSLTID